MLFGFSSKRSKKIGNVTNLATRTNVYKTAKIVCGLGEGITIENGEHDNLGCK
jgi:hypothetical protein